MQAALGNFAGVRIRSRQIAHSSSAAAASEPPASELPLGNDDRAEPIAEEVDGKRSPGAGAGAGDGSSALRRSAKVRVKVRVKVVAGIAALKTPEKTALALQSSRTQSWESFWL